VDRLDDNQTTFHVHGLFQWALSTPTPVMNVERKRSVNGSRIAVVVST
jgi:hypothetical protein